MAYQRQENNGLLAYLSARELSITWGSDPRYWKWYTICDDIEVAELIDVCWQEIVVKYDEQKLKPGLKYEVKFVVELKDNLVMNGPVNLSLTLPDGQTQEHQEDLTTKPKNVWIGLKAGEFTAQKHCVCDNNIKCSLTGHDGTTWKSGLVIIGAIISIKI